MLFVLTNEYKAAGDARIGARRALCERSALMGLLRSCFARTQTWLQAGKYLNALVSDLPSRNGWTIGEQAGDQTPARANAGELRVAACCQAVWVGSRCSPGMSNGGPVGRVSTKITCRRRTSVARSVCHQFCCHVDYQDDHGGGGGVRPGSSG